MKKSLYLFALLAILVFAFVSCDDNQQLIINQTTPTPTIRGTVSIPEGSGFTGSDFFIRIMEGEKAVYTGRVNADGSFSVPGLREEATYSILLTTEEPGDIKGTEKDISRATKTSGMGGWLSNVTASINEQAGVGSVKVKPLGTIKGVVTKDGAEDGYDTTVYIPGTSYLAMTDGQGNFSIFNVPQATYTLRYISNGYMAKMVSNVVLYSDSDTENPVTTVEPQKLIRNAGNLIGTVTKAADHDQSGTIIYLDNGKNTYTSVTDSFGSVRVTDIIPGIYRATISAEGFITQTIDDIVIEAAKNTTLDAVSLIANGGNLSGKVIADREENRAGALVNIVSSDGRYSYTASTDTNGVFIFSNVFPGTYSLTLTQTGYAIVTRADIVPVSGQTTYLDDFILSSNFGTVEGKVTDTRNNPIENAIVKIGDISVFTDEQGRFSKTGIGIGNYSVTIGKTSYTTETLPQTITVESSKTTDIGTIQIASIYGLISGTVVVNDGRSTEGIHISAVSSDSTNSYSTLTKADGTFLLSNVVAGTYLITAKQMGYSDSSETVAVTAGNEAVVPEMALISRFGSVSGKLSLTESADNSGVTVTLTYVADTTIAPTTISGADGTYTFSNLTHAGQYTITFSKDGYISNTGTIVNVSFGQNTRVEDITLKSLASTVKGTATLEGTEDFTGISVLLKAKDNSRQYDASTDKQGNYVMSKVSPGEYTLTVSKAGFVSKTISDIIVESSTEKTLDAVALAIGVRSVTGSITAELKTDYSGFLVTATNLSDDTKVYSAITNSAGAYTLAGMVPGEYSIVISHSGYRTLTLPTVNVIEGSTKTLESSYIEINRGTISGVVTLEGKTRSSGIIVELLQGDKTIDTKYTNEAGGYSFCVPQGNYSAVRMTMTDFISKTVPSAIALFADNYISIETTELQATANTVYGKVDVISTNDESGVSISIEGHEEINALMTESNGTFTFEHVPLGSYTLRFQRENCSDILIPVSVVVSDGINLGTVLLAPNSASIKGKVNLENGSSLSGVLVSVNLGDRTLTGYTDVNGRYEIGGISVTDTYAATYSKDGWNAKTQQISPKLEKLEVREMNEITLVDTTAPVLNSVVINSGANTASDKDVTLHFKTTEQGSGVEKVMITYDNVFDRTVTRHDYIASMNWALPSGNGEKVIYVKVVDAAGNESNTVTATVTLTDQKTEVSGVLTGDKLHWTEANSPYLVIGNIMVERDKTLTIDPGVDVQFAGPYYIQVEGLIEAIGTEEKQISFYGIDEGVNTWQGINCVSKKLVLSGEGGSLAYESGSILSYAIIQNCKYGISGYAYVSNSLIETNNTILGNDSGYFCGMIEKSSIRGSLRLRDAKLCLNVVSASNIIIYCNNGYTSGSGYFGPCFLYCNEIQATSIRNTYSSSYRCFDGEGNKFEVSKIYNLGKVKNCTFIGGTIEADLGAQISICDVSFVDCTLTLIGSSGTEKIDYCSFVDCSFDSLNVSSVNYCNFINCSMLRITQSRSNTAEYNMKYNFWGYDKTREMNETGDNSNLSFITDYYDDFNKTKVVYSDWVQEPYSFVGYKGDAYSTYTIVSDKPKPEQQTVKWDADYNYSISNPNTVTVTTTSGNAPAWFRVFQNLDLVAGEDKDNDLWMPMNNDVAAFNHDPFTTKSGYWIQFKDQYGNISDFFSVSVVPLFGGPGGGYVFYDCDEDNDSGNADGLISTECGWRFLEAAPADLRVVDGVPTVDSNASGYLSGTYFFVFGYYRTTDDGSNLYVNGTTTYNAADCTGTAIGTGKANTQLLVNAMGAETYSIYSGASKTGNYAARLCDFLTYTVNGVTYDDWFLPSKDELNLMYMNLHEAGLGGFASSSYWSSSEYNDYSYYAWIQYFSGGSQPYYRYYDNRVRPVRAF